MHLVDSASSSLANARRLAVVCAHVFVAVIRGALLLAIGRRPAVEVWGAELRALFVRLGPAYIKIGQLLSTRADLLPAPVIKRLAALQDHLPPMSESEVRHAIAASLGSTVNDIYEEFSFDPIGSGSIACVYLARIDGDQAVAVKVRRPGVWHQIIRDVEAICWIASKLAIVPPLMNLPIVESLAEIGDCLVAQTDFGREANNLRRMQAALSPETRVRLPRLIDHLCTDELITMEYLPDFHSAQSGDRSASTTTALRMLYRMIFVEGLVHCDLHNSNLALRTDAEVCLTDFGFVAELSHEGRLGFAEFFYCLSRNDGPRCAQLALRMAACKPPHLDYPRFEREIADAVSTATGTRARDFSVARFAVQMFEIQRRHRVRSTTSFQMAIISLVVLEGIIRSYCPALDFQREARPYILRSSLRAASPRVHAELASSLPGATEEA